MLKLNTNLDKSQLTILSRKTKQLANKERKLDRNLIYVAHVFGTVIYLNLPDMISINGGLSFDSLPLFICVYPSKPSHIPTAQPYNIMQLLWSCMHKCVIFTAAF